MYENKTETAIRNPNCKTYISLSLMPGRTGNDMFQVAALIGIAKRNGLIPLLNDRLSKMDWFYFPDLNFDFPLENVKKHHVEMPGVYADETENLNPAYNWTVRGYLQSWKYFENAASVVRQIFKIKSVYMTPAKNFLNSISKTGYVNVCLHYRRGDMLMTSAIRRGYTVAGLDFVAKAMTFYEQKFTNVTFVVLSDGIQWCRNNIKKSNVVFSPFEVAAIDFALLTSCDHVIVTSGTFGWWGAWLSRGTTAYYAGYPGVNTWLETKMDRSDYYPNDWIGIL
ncbi:galactoside alpha-(1,2)-fucosyltransferase 2-like [Mya arenaria]|nr:galactoside alpha-(1,2)-fucosyltransferase 2-like [Mya arenaria]